jgi:predicted transposase/invertase (TIGR01784 family)
METLDPRLDVVFKLLFGAAQNRGLLKMLIEDVLQPERPIVSLDVVNPEIERESVDGRGLVLDVHVVHDDGTRTNVEMQTYHRPGMEQRALFHWARIYANALPRGAAFSSLPRVRVIFFLTYRLLPGTRLHSRYRVLEAEDGHLLSDALEIHTIEVPKLEGGSLPARDAGVATWARFFAARDDASRREVAMTDPRMEQVLSALDLLSEDSRARWFARWREDQLVLDEMGRREELRQAREEAERRGREAGRDAGREEGREQGREQGRDALRAAAVGVARELGLSVDAAREAWLARLDLASLEVLPVQLLRTRRWPD